MTEQKTERGKKSASTRMRKKQEIIDIAIELSTVDTVEKARALGRELSSLFAKPSPETYIVIAVGKKQQYAGPFRNRNVKEKLEYFTDLFAGKGATINTTPATDDARQFAAELMAASVATKSMEAKK